MKRFIQSLTLIHYGALFIGIVCILAFFLQGTYVNIYDLVAALFSGLALLGIIATVRMQKQELKLQRKELASTRREFQQQNLTMKLQRFENTFFQLLQKQWEIGLKVGFYNDMHDVYLEGKFAFDTLWHEFLRKIKDANQKKFDNSMDRFNAGQRDAPNVLTQEEIIEAVKEVYLKRKPYVEQYFRHLIVVLRYVIECDYSIPSASKYIDFIFAQMSGFEVQCVFYFGTFTSDKLWIQQCNIRKYVRYREMYQQSDLEFYKEVDLDEVRSELYDDWKAGIM